MTKYQHKNIFQVLCGCLIAVLLEDNFLFSIKQKNQNTFGKREGVIHVFFGCSRMFLLLKMVVFKEQLKVFCIRESLQNRSLETVLKNYFP